MELGFSLDLGVSTASTWDPPLPTLCSLVCRLCSSLRETSKQHFCLLEGSFGQEAFIRVDEHTGTQGRGGDQAAGSAL